MAIFCGCLSGMAQPPIPSEWYPFQSENSYSTLYGSAPIAYTNLISTPMNLDSQDWFYGNILILDTTNLVPALLNYPVLETNYGTAHRNLFYSSGTVLFYVCANWQSAGLGDGATGPGQTAYFISGGDWSSNSPNGLFAIYADSRGENLCFGGVGEGTRRFTQAHPFRGVQTPGIKSGWNGPSGIARFTWMARWPPRETA